MLDKIIMAYACGRHEGGDAGSSHDNFSKRTVGRSLS
jgi:hypothetical protein